MKKITVIIMIMCFFVGIMAVSGLIYNASAAPPPSPLVYEAYPPFMAASVPPLVMLVMGRNHKLYYEAYNDASDLNGDGTLDVGYNPAIEYYGYFDSYKVYTYDTSDQRFEPVRVTSDKKTSGSPSAGEWSGDYLNYLTMSRMDTLRKVLYGGYRSTDTAKETVLQRVYVPQDAHSWGKEYTDVATDGYDISDYAPFAPPTVNTRHLFGSTTLSDNGNPVLRILENNSHRIWEWLSKEGPICGTRCANPNPPPRDEDCGGVPDDYVVRVLVGVSSMPEVNCKEYPSGVYKPIGILQRHGETNSMYFGLLTGSYAKNTSGGVLRKKMGSITDEINTNTGEFIIPSGGNIIDTINRLRISEFRYGSYDYEPGWSGAWVTTRAMNEGEFPDWGNPIGEMMYEGLRYFAGKATPTTDFHDNNMSEDNALGLPNASWDDPYTTYAYCAKPFMLVLSDINPTYDSDQLPGSYFGSAPSPNDLSGLDVASIADTIFTNEGLSGLYYIGQQNTNYNGSCAPKTASGFGDIRGLCPEEPTKEGSYYSASVANFGRTQDINPIQGDQNVLTYTVALASPLPKIEIPIGGNTITLVPFAKSVGGCLGIVGTEGVFQPTNTIVDFYVETITSDSGKFRINFEDVEQAADHDMDAIVEYEYQVTGNTVNITLNSTYASGCIIQHVGYIISGTTADGTYLEVRDFDTTAGNDLDYFLDTPVGQGPGGTWQDSADLPLNTTRTFTVGTSSGAELLKNPLWYAAKWGGFEDKNQNLEPDRQDEWDKDGDGTPDTYFYVVNPLKLEEQLNKSFANILEKAASGTAASVLATNSEGEGNLVQAYFKPKWTTAGGKDLTWLGFIQSLWVDSCGNLREDSNQNRKLDLQNAGDSSVASGDVDEIITYFTNANGATLIRRYTTHYMYNPLNRKNCDCVLDSLPTPVTCTNAYDEVALNEIEPIFEAGKLLAQRSADTRKIFTFIDGNGEDDDTDTHIDESGEVEGVTKHVGRVSDPFDDDPFDDDDEVIRFHINNYSSIKPFLGVKHSPNWSYLDANSSSPDHDSRVKNLIEYIRGKDDTDLTGSTNARSRTDDNNKVWKLGDIVNSTPMSIAKPPEKYHIIYQDPSYQAYYTWAKDRETVVYAGGNDGMLHAFTSWRYDRSSGQYFKPTGAGANEKIGDEIWAYIPQTLLPHLKWLADPDYSHSFYVDQRPKVFDAKIIDDETHYSDLNSDDDWGTILLVGLNMGGKHCWAEGDFDSNSGTADVTRHFYPTYICMDISDPRNPRLLWERSYENLGMSRSTPAVVKIKTSPTDSNGKWFVVFGSGPNDSAGVSDYSGMSDQNGYIFVVDLKTGDLSKAFDTNEPNAFMNSPVSFDKDLDYNVDAIYCGSASKSGTPPSWKGKAYKINTHDGVGTPSTDVINHWALTTLFDAEKPITASFGLSVDGFDNVWAYFGTGRYIGNADKTDEDQQYIFGIKDPYFNTGPKNTSSPLGISDIFDATPYSVYTNGLVTSTGGLTRITSWKSLIEAVRNTEDQTSYPDIFDGWYRTLTITTGEPSERVISKPGVLGGITFFPGYTPNNDICGYGGDTNFYGLYYETGTAYYKSILPGDLETVTGQPYFKVNPKIYIGHGVPPPSIGFHLGRQKGAKAFLQISTGEVVDLDIETAFSIKSGITRWREP